MLKSEISTHQILDQNQFIIFNLLQEMKPNPEPNKQSQPFKQDFQYIYFKDTEGRLKRLRKKDYQSRTGYIRLKFLEKYFFWWKKKSFDYRNAIITLFMGMTYAYIIYVTSMFFSQNQLERQIKARLPFDYQNSQMDEMKKIHKEDLKKQSKLSLL